jgi:hypothetical protein
VGVGTLDVGAVTVMVEAEAEGGDDWGAGEWISD